VVETRPFALSCALLLTGCAAHAPEASEPASLAMSEAARARVSLPRLPALEAEPTIRVLLAEGAAAAAVSADELPGELTRVGDGEATLAILTLPMETYLRGVVSAEIPAAWGVETKMAQAIAARSYAISHLGSEEPFDVRSTTLDQVYRPRENAGAVEAVAATRGLVLADPDRGAVVEAFYHSTCGGHTENAAEVWPKATPYRWATSCTTCAASPRYRWEVSLPTETVAGAHPGLDRVDAVRLDSAPSGRALRVTLVAGETEHTMMATEFRRAIGTSTLRSTFFETEASEATFTFRGRGFGHGVGLCQWGTHGLVANGHDHRAVLAHYYRGATLHRIYE
jgi:stage II sporulation protein D